MNAISKQQWFEDNSQYTDPVSLPESFGSRPVPLVRVYDSGKTQPGWGAKEFIDNERRGRFKEERVLKFFEEYNEPFGIIMRGLPMVCVDIDGKNGGIPTARVLGLPETTAEISKSGNGYHLFYEVPGTKWSRDRGFDEFPDIINLLPGVDIKGTGIVYHYPVQLWNDKPFASLPPSLARLLGAAREVKLHARLSREGILALDDDERVIVHDQIKNELDKSVEVGKRNQTLYRLGARMRAALYPNWDMALFDRGLELGLEPSEIKEIIRNVNVYG